MKVTRLPKMAKYMTPVTSVTNTQPHLLAPCLPVMATGTGADHSDLEGRLGYPPRRF